MDKITFREAFKAGIVEALDDDSRVFLIGEDVAKYGGCYAVSKCLLDTFGPQRIIDTPLSESGFVGAGIGAAIGGMRPIVEIMTVNFSLLALDAALQLETLGIDAEVVDLRCLRPLDRETILDSVRRTHKARIVDQSWKSGGMSAEVSATIAELGLCYLDAPINRICTAEVPIPYAYHLEQASLPHVVQMIAVAKQMMESAESAIRDPL